MPSAARASACSETSDGTASRGSHRHRMAIEYVRKSTGECGTKMELMLLNRGRGEIAQFSLRAPRGALRAPRVSQRNFRDLESAIYTPFAPPRVGVLSGELIGVLCASHIGAVCAFARLASLCALAREPRQRGFTPSPRARTRCRRGNTSSTPLSSLATGNNGDVEEARCGLDVQRRLLLARAGRQGAPQPRTRFSPPLS
jgi:hypothetical protein